MFTTIYSPDKLDVAELDRYLSIGWFRMTQSIFTCRFLCFKSNLYSAVWTRLNLSGYSAKKSQRKIIRKVYRDFEVLVMPALLNEEKEALYQVHRKRFEGYVAKSLTSSLMGDNSSNIYNTWEISIYDNDRLIGASFFDLGKNSIASIMGIFDPEYSSYSLGYFTMLEEISFGQKNGFSFYYPGYVVPGYEKFDYKLRVGDLEFYDFDRELWFPYADIQLNYLPSEKLSNALAEVQELLKDKVQTSILLYPHYDKYWYGLDAIFAVEQPLILTCFDTEKSDHGIIVEFDIRTNEYSASKVIINREDSEYIEYLSTYYNKESCMLNFVFKDEILITSKDPQKVASLLWKFFIEKTLL